MTDQGLARRGWVLLAMLIFAVVLLNYVDRGAIGIAAPFLKTELGLSATQFGLAVSAFFWVYAPAQFAVGWAVDRWSVGRLLGLGVLLWALATMATGLAHGIVLLVALRALLGLGEAFTFPAASKVIANHVPDARRGMANAAVGMGISFGPAIGTLAGGLIALHYGWRAMFVVFGAVTLLWLLPWLTFSSGRGGESRASAPPPPFGAFARNRAAWSMGIAHFTATWGHYFVIAWLPLYFVQQRGYPFETMTLIVTALLGVQGLATLAMGWHSDRWSARGGDEGQYRRWSMILCQLAVAAGILGVATVAGIGDVWLWMIVLGIAAAGSTIHNYAVGQMFGGKRAAGGFIGFQNGLGNMSGIVGPIATGLIIDVTGSFNGAFILAAAVAAGGAAVWLFLVPAIVEQRFD